MRRKCAEILEKLVPCFLWWKVANVFKAEQVLHMCHGKLTIELNSLLNYQNSCSRSGQRTCQSLVQTVLRRESDAKEMLSSKTHYATGGLLSKI